MKGQPGVYVIRLQSGNSVQYYTGRSTTCIKSRLLKHAKDSQFMCFECDFSVLYLKDRAKIELTEYLVAAKFDKMWLSMNKIRPSITLE